MMTISIINLTNWCKFKNKEVPKTSFLKNKIMKKHKYILVCRNFLGAMDKWRSGRWARITFDDGTVTVFTEAFEEMCVELPPGSQIIYEQGWSEKVDLVQSFIADPLDNRLHKF